MATTTITPAASNHDGLAALASRYVDVAALPWVPTRWPGIELKVLTKFAPGAKLPDHEHVEIEQSYVIEGSLADEEGVATRGNYVWRPGGSRHTAHSPDGCIVLSFFLKPNKFF
jgi:ChrR Cupin-like domain